MIRTDVATVVILPKRRLHQSVLFLIPLGEGSVQQSAGVTGVGVDAPESVVDVVFDHVIPQQTHPLLVLASVHVSAPLADQQGRNALVVDVCPGVVPVIIQQGLGGEILVKPGLCINGGAIIVGGVHQLILMLAQVDGVILYAPQVAAPPCRMPGRRTIHSRLPHVWGIKVVPLLCLGVLLNALHHDQHVGVDLQDLLGTGFSSVFPVVFVRRIVPLCNGCGAGSGVVAPFAMRLVFQIQSDQGVVILIPVSQPYPGIHPDLRGDHNAGAHFLAVPKLVIVTGVVGVRTVYIHHDLDAVFLTQLQQHIKNFQAVHLGAILPAKLRVEAVVRGVFCIDAGSRIRLTDHPVIQQLRGYRDPQQVDAVIRNGCQRVAHVTGPESVQEALAAIHAEPVCTGEPDLVAVHIVQLVSFSVKPVIVCVVHRAGTQPLSAHSIRKEYGGTCQKRSSRHDRRSFAPELFHKFYPLSKSAAAFAAVSDYMQRICTYN